MAVVGAVLGAALVTSARSARADSPALNKPRNPITVDTNLGCWHTQSWARSELNQRNLGLGVTIPLDPIADAAAATAGFYRNSYDRTSFYAGVLYQPIQFRAFLNWKAGAIFGIVTGYRADEEPDRPLLAALALTGQTDSGFGVRLSFVPASFTRPGGGGDQSGAIGLQLLIPWN
jgi:hypothetical protein